MKRLNINITFLLFSLMLIRTDLLVGQVDCAGYDLVFKAEQLYRSEQHLQEAITLYKAAFEYGVKHAPNVFDAITCATSIRDTNAAIGFLTYGLQIGIEVSDYYRLWQYLGNGMEVTQLIVMTDTTEAIRIFESRLNKELIDEINKGAFRDQEFRDRDSVDWMLQRENDSLNWKSLKTLVTMASQFPGRSALGMQCSDDLELLFHHMDKDELQWFLPFIAKAIQQYECNLGPVILYQLDRIGMDQGLIFTLTEDYRIVEHSSRTKMKNNMWCQSFGEWFDERDMVQGKMYFTPTDPLLTIEEINWVRHLLCLDSLESRCKRKPWVSVVSVEAFEQIFPFSN
ncbi:MAG: hypothetical protein IPN60_00090 [Saprospiraceae bacterium]|nr:hypothetical protein [Candidatus Opimibacter skivensis]